MTKWTPVPAPAAQLPALEANPAGLAASAAGPVVVRLVPVPTSANGSPAAAVAFIDKQVRDTSETAEPMDASGFAPPAPDNTEPEPGN